MKFMPTMLVHVLLLLPSAVIASDETREDIATKVEQFVGQPAAEILCKPIEEKNGSPPNPATCAELGRKILEACWADLTLAVPGLSKPLEEYTNLLSPDDLAMIKDTARTCIRSGMHLSKEDRTRYFEMRSGRTNEEPEEVLASSWIDAVTAAVAQSMIHKTGVLALANAFQGSDYVAVHYIKENLVFGTVEANGELVTSKLDSVPDWIASMPELGIDNVERFSSILRINSEAPMSTTEHMLMTTVVFEGADDLPACKPAFESLDCGVCLGTAATEFNVLVTWFSKALAEAPGSSDDMMQSGNRLARCIDSGIEQARRL